jgi:linoleoyl-CoA desaturase
MSRAIPLAIGYVVSIVAPFPRNLPGVVIFAVSTVSVLGSWFHDGVHRNLKTPLAPVMMRLGSSPVGFSTRWWLVKHLRLHHRYPGDPALDPDIQFGYLARVSAAQPWRRPHAAQHLYLWPLYPFATLKMLKFDEPGLARRYLTLLGSRRVPATHALLVEKYLPMVAVWAPIFLCHPILDALLTFLVFHLVTGLLVSLITQIQHNTALADTTGRAQSHRPLCRQLARTTDVGHSRGMWWWICGGVNFHVVHHLAPTLTFLELPGATARLRADLREVGVEVPTHNGLAAATRSHAILLRSLSRPSGPAAAAPLTSASFQPMGVRCASSPATSVRPETVAGPQTI